MTVNVTSSTAGSHPNTSDGVVSTETGPAPGASSNTAYLTVMSPPTISKAFSPATVAINSPSTLTVTITNPNAGSALTGVGFSDTYPANLVNTATPNGSTTCAGGTVTAAAGGGSVSLSGGTIPAGGSCTVTANVMSAATGTYNNTTGNVTSTEGGAGSTASATLTVDLQPTFTKSFGTNPVLARGTSLITFSITNNSATAALTNMAFTDVFPTFPGQMSLASAATTNTCNGTLADSGGGAIGIGDIGHPSDRRQPCNRRHLYDHGIGQNPGGRPVQQYHQHPYQLRADCECRDSVPECVHAFEVVQPEPDLADRDHDAQAHGDQS